MCWWARGHAHADRVWDGAQGGTSTTAGRQPDLAPSTPSLLGGNGVGLGRCRRKTHCWVLREQPPVGDWFFGSPRAPGRCVRWCWGLVAGPLVRYIQLQPCGWGGWVSGAGGGPGRCLRTAQWTRASLFSVVEVCKGTGWMPWHQEPKKDVVACDMPRGVGKRTVIRGSPNGETPHQSCGVTPA